LVAAYNSDVSSMFQTNIYKQWREIKQTFTGNLTIINWNKILTNIQWFAQIMKKQNVDNHSMVCTNNDKQNFDKHSMVCTNNVIKRLKESKTKL